MFPPKVWAEPWPLEVFLGVSIFKYRKRPIKPEVAYLISEPPEGEGGLLERGLISCSRKRL